MTIVQLITDDREPSRDYDNPNPSFGAAPAALLEGFAAHPEVKVHVISCSQRAMRSSPAQLAGNIWFHSLHVPKWGWLRSGYAGCVRATRNKIQSLAPDLVHGQGTERYCALSACYSQRPNLVTIHGNMLALAKVLRARVGSFYWLAARLETHALSRTQGVFCNSHYTETLVRDRSRRTWLVANAIRSEFLASSKPQSRSSPPVVLNVGVISPRKRQRELLGIARRLHERGLNLRWKFIGEANPADSYAKAFLTQLSDPAVKGYATYCGTQSVSALVDTFDQAAALVHFPTEEAFGLVVAEALARGLKVFASKVGGIRDITNGTAGAELIAAHDWSALEESLTRWAEAGVPSFPANTEKMVQRYTPAAIAKRHLEIYEELLQGQSRYRPT